MSVCLYACMSVCLYVCMSVCLYVCMSVCLSVCNVCNVCMYVCMSVRTYVCMHVCVCVCMYLGRMVGTDRWAGFGRTLCEAEPQHGMRWVRATHDRKPVAGGFQCGRCHLPVAAARYARAATARCPAWTLEGTGGAVPGRVQWSAQLAHLGPTWKRSHGGIGRAAAVVSLLERVGAGAPGAGPGVVRQLQPFRGHVAVMGAGRTICLACGRADAVRARLARFLVTERASYVGCI